MTESQLQKFLGTLLMQDHLLNSSALDEHRRNLIQRVAEAKSREQAARKRTIGAAAACLVIFVGVYACAIFRMRSLGELPDWMRYLCALAVILSPLTALLLFTIYFFRYRLEFVRAKKRAAEQVLLDMPNQIASLRHELDQLRAQLPASAPPGPGTGTGRENGFTLLEMLMVVLILGLLAAMVLPALAAAKAKGRTASCKNNLRQMAHGLAMYEADFGWLPGAGDVLIPFNHAPWQLPSTNSWAVRLRPYLSSNTDLFICPSAKVEWNWDQTIRMDMFGYNAGGSSRIYQNMEKKLGLGFGKDDFIRSSSLRAPADMVALGDLQTPNSVWLNIISPWHTEPIGPILSLIPDRHSGGANIVFADSHAQWATQGRWIAETSGARARWNNDHQPHPETW